jgi:hypothetical protein
MKQATVAVLLFFFALSALASRRTSSLSFFLHPLHNTRFTNVN